MDTQSLAGSVIAYGGVRITEFGTGAALTITEDGPLFTSVVGVDGTKARSYTNCETFKLEIELLPGAKANKYFMASLIADAKLSKLGAGGVVFPFLWKGTNLDTFVSGEVWITGRPVITVSNNVEMRKWMLETGPGTLIVGA